MQLMPGTASKLGVKDSFDPAKQTWTVASAICANFAELYNGDMVKALAAYNAGPQRVDQYKGVPPYRETHAYVARVIKDYNRKKLAERSSWRRQGAKLAKPNATKPALTQTASLRRPAISSPV